MDDKVTEKLGLINTYLEDGEYSTAGKLLEELISIRQAQATPKAESQSAEDFARFLNAEACNRIVKGIGKEARDVGVYDPKYDAVLIAQRDRDTLTSAADRVCDDCTDCTVEELEDVKPTCRKLKAILAPLAEGEKP